MGATQHEVDIERQHAGLVMANDELRRLNEALVLAAGRYMALYDLAPTPLVTLDEWGRILDVNHAAERLLGATRTELVTLPFVSLLDDSVGRAIGPQLAELFRTGSLTGGECIVARAGSRAEISIYGIVLADEGRPHALLACVDMTETKRAEGVRQELARRAQEAARLESLGTLAGGIAHDFNNLMTVVLAGAEQVLYDLPESSPHHEPLAEVRQAARHAGHLAHQMLAYSGHVSRPPRAVDLAALVRELDPLLRATAKSVPVEVAIDADLPAVVADETQLRQVLLNLVLNAAESMSGRAGVITVTVRTSPGAERVILEVRDAGSGMTAVTRARIFDPYFTTKFAGRGLGLAVVQGAVRALDGTLDVDTEVGRGTAITIQLKAVRDQAVVTAAPEPLDWRGCGTVLFVDDDDGLRRTVARLLRRLGLSPIVAASGGEALEILADPDARIDLVLTDLTMPAMDGVELARRIKGMNGELPIVLVTGYGELPHACDGLFYGALAKPFSLVDLCAVLRPLLPIRPE